MLSMRYLDRVCTVAERDPEAINQALYYIVEEYTKFGPRAVGGPVALALWFAKGTEAFNLVMGDKSVRYDPTLDFSFRAKYSQGTVAQAILDGRLDVIHKPNICKNIIHSIGKIYWALTFDIAEYRAALSELRRFVDLHNNSEEDMEVTSYTEAHLEVLCAIMSAETFEENDCAMFVR